VVVVDNGSTDATGEELAKYPWVDVVSNDENRGSARGCNQGAAVARGDVIVFLNNETIVHGGWLEELLAPFADPEVGAVGPRSNSVSGHQLVEGASYRSDAVTAIGEFAEEWRRAHGGSTSECARLVGFCLAVRAETFKTVEGFDEEYRIGGRPSRFGSIARKCWSGSGRRTWIRPTPPRTSPSMPPPGRPTVPAGRMRGPNPKVRPSFGG
jgi:GT2 family glycosyltransferase